MGGSMSFDTFNAVFFTAAFLVPGFIWSAVLSMLVSRKSTEPQMRAVEFLTFSCINYGLWSWLIYPLFYNEWWGEHPYVSGAALFVIAFASPIGLGLVSGWMAQRNTVATVLERFGFNTVLAIPTAWDYHFSRGRPHWVIVTLRDGSRLYGLFGLESFAGDGPESQDLYLETAFTLTDTEEWAPVEDSDGVWISAEQIAVLEFRKVYEVEHGEQTNEQAN